MLYSKDNMAETWSSETKQDTGQAKETRPEFAKQTWVVEGRCGLEQSESPAAEQTTVILEEERTFPALPSQHFHCKASQILD